MHLSKWLYSRGLFPLAKVLRSINSSHFSSIDEHRAALVSLFKDYRTMLGQGVVAQFDEATYSDAIGFALPRRGFYRRQGARSGLHEQHAGQI